ncbi:MAG: hypothetical protein RJR37_00205 [Peptococcaceae bacterium MAG4]|nr:hypothetical protein [Peptococcaceae bacterium MAG4]
MSGLQTRLLHRLARLYGVETSYLDYQGTRRQATPESLLAALRALGAPLAKPEHLPGALRETIQRRWQRTCEPVVVAWEGKTPAWSCACPAGLPLAPPAAGSSWRTGGNCAGPAAWSICPGLDRPWWKGKSIQLKACPYPAGCRKATTG